MSSTGEGPRPKRARISDLGCATPARSIILDRCNTSTGQSTELVTVKASEPKAFFPLFSSFEQVLELHRNNGEYLFFFVDEWQKSGLQADEIMWGIGPAELNTGRIREVPCLAGSYRYPLWPMQVMLKISNGPPCTWRRATLKKIGQTRREVELIRDQLVFEFIAMANAPLTLEFSDEVGFVENVVENVVENFPFALGEATAAANVDLQSQDDTGAPANGELKLKPTAVVAATLPISSKSDPDCGKCRFLFPYQKMTVGSEALIKGMNIFVSPSRLKEIHKQCNSKPEEYVKVLVKELLGLDSEATKAYIGGMSGKGGITNTATPDFLPALKRYFSRFPNLKETRISFIASQLVNKWRE